eukprot:Skav210617  [mRNA]  locus=scaffold234:359064:363615:- [translate_table: standard]
MAEEEQVFDFGTKKKKKNKAGACWGDLLGSVPTKALRKSTAEVAGFRGSFVGWKSVA